MFMPPEPAEVVGDKIVLCGQHIARRTRQDLFLLHWCVCEEAEGNLSHLGKSLKQGQTVVFFLTQDPQLDPTVLMDPSQLDEADLGEPTASQSRLLGLESPKLDSSTGLSWVSTRELFKIDVCFPKASHRPAAGILVWAPTSPLRECQ